MTTNAASEDVTDLAGDAYVRSYSNDLPVYQFETLAVTVPPPLSAARVAIVTTAGLRADGARAWQRADQGFSVLPDDRRDFVLAHSSPNFDRTGFVADLNVVFPVDRLHNMGLPAHPRRTSPTGLSPCCLDRVEDPARRRTPTRSRTDGPVMVGVHRLTG